MDDYCLWQNWEGHDGPYARFWHPSFVANGQGIDTDPDDFGPDVVYEQLIKFIDSSDEQPFFVYWPSTLAHMERDTETDVWYFPEMPEVDRDGNRTGKRVEGSLESVVRCQDGLVKLLLDHLDSTGLMEQTIVFFVADNGSPGYGKGLYNNEVALRVPYLVCGGGVKKIGASDVLTDFSDIWPTLADLMGYEGPYGGSEEVDGYSIAPFLLGKPYTRRTFIEMNTDFARWLRDEDWLLDGYGHFWDCRGTRNEWEYTDVTYSNDPEVIKARKRFEQRLRQVPLPDYEDPLTKESWEQFRQNNPEIQVYAPPNL